MIHGNRFVAQKGNPMSTCIKCDEPTVGKSKYCRDHRAEARENWKNTVAASAEAREARDLVYWSVYLDACAAAQLAYDACTPEPMMVYETVGLSDIPKPNGKTWIVDDGVCGFAWIVIKPATSSFARWCARENIGRNNYGGGWAIPSHRLVSNEGQSYERKTAAMRAAVQVLRNAGINCRVDSRLD